MSVNDQLKGGYQGFQVLNSANALTLCKILLSPDESELFPLPVRARYAYPSTQSAGEIFPSGRSRAICLSPGPEMLY